MLPESTLLWIEDLGALNAAPAEAFSALPSTLAIDVDTRADLAPVVNRIVSADSGRRPRGRLPGTPGPGCRDRQRGADGQPAGRVGHRGGRGRAALTLRDRDSRDAAAAPGAGPAEGTGHDPPAAGSVVTWQAMTILAIAIVVGLPVGLTVGRVASGRASRPRSAWSRSSWHPSSCWSSGPFALLLVGAVLAAAPALLAARAPTTMALRVE